MLYPPTRSYVIRFTKSKRGMTTSQSIDSSMNFTKPPAAKLKIYFSPISFLNVFTNSVKLSLSALSYLWPGYPSIAGYSQSRSIPSILYCLKSATVVFAKLLRCSAEANRSEQGAQPPQPPIDTMIFKAGCFFFNWTSCSNVFRCSSLWNVRVSCCNFKKL